MCVFVRRQGLKADQTQKGIGDEDADDEDLLLERQTGTSLQTFTQMHFPFPFPSDPLLDLFLSLFAARIASACEFFDSSVPSINMETGIALID